MTKSFVGPTTLASTSSVMSPRSQCSRRGTLSCVWLQRPPSLLLDRAGAGLALAGVVLLANMIPRSSVASTAHHPQGWDLSTEREALRQRKSKGGRRNQVAEQGQAQLCQAENTRLVPTSCSESSPVLVPLAGSTRHTFSIISVSPTWCVAHTACEV